MTTQSLRFALLYGALAIAVLPACKPTVDGEAISASSTADSAFIVITEGVNYSFSSTTPLETSTHEFTLTNRGAGLGSSIAIQLTGERYTLSANTCDGITLAASASCTFTLNFSPIASETASGTLSVSYVSAGISETFTMTLTGVGETASTSPAGTDSATSSSQPAAGQSATVADVYIITSDTNYDFGDVQKDTTLCTAFTVINLGGTAATALTEKASAALTAPFSFQGSSYPGTNATCGATLASGASCTVRACFSPTTVATATPKVLSLSYLASDTTKTATKTLQGAGVLSASASTTNGLIIVTSDTSYSFGDVQKGSSKCTSISLLNSGSAIATDVKEKVGSELAAPFSFFETSAYPGTYGTCGTSLAAGASCSLRLCYSPTTSGVTDTDILTISYVSNGSTYVATKNFSGSGVLSLTISLGFYHGCAILSNGATKCWGTNTYGQLGNALSYDGATPDPLDADLNPVKFTSNPVGLDSLTLPALTTPASVYRLDGSSAATTAISVATPRAPYDWATCAALQTGQVKCWGKNTVGGAGTYLLGDGDTSLHYYAAPVNPVLRLDTGLAISTAVQVVGADYSFCARLQNGSVLCWGVGTILGNGSVEGRSKAVQVTGLSGSTSDNRAIDISMSKDTACAVVESGKVYCWGSGSSGQMGNGTTGGTNPAPVEVTGISSAVQVSVGYYFVMARLSDGSVKAWGHAGALGIESNTDQSTPVAFGSFDGTTADKRAVDIAAGINESGNGDFGCAVTESKKLYCAGYHMLDGVASAKYHVPAELTALAGATKVSAYNALCVTLDSGAVKCWGYSANSVTGTYYLGSTTTLNTLSGLVP